MKVEAHKETEDMEMVEAGKSGDVELGASTLRTPGGSIDQVYGVTLEWRDISFAVKDKQILSGVSGFVESGSLCAVMGPSGSGKTTLLDVIAERMRTDLPGRSLTGDVLFNGQQVTSAALRDYACYVQQEDALIGVLTVRETMEFAAKLTGAPQARIAPIITALGLESTLDTIVGTIFFKGISGGQKRRLSIAVELLSKPSLLILDEPTSGLDSASALAVMEHLKSLAVQGGRTVLATIHQPSNHIWELMDKVLFLERGHPVYFGPSGTELLDFFSRVGHKIPQFSNIPDFVMSTINRDFPGHGDVEAIVAAFAKEFKPPSLEFNELKDKDDRHDSASVLSRLCTLCVRGFLELKRDPGIIGVRLVMYTMLALLIGLMYLGLGNDKTDSDIVARTAILFYTAAFMVFMSVAVLPFLMLQRDVFTKERCNGAYKVPEYVASKFIVSVPGVFVLALVTTILVVLPSGLNGFGIFLVTLFLSLLVAEGFMAFMASVVPHFIIGIALAAGVFGFFMLCEGYFKIRSDIPPYLIWGYHIGFHTYSFRTFMYNEFKPIRNLDSALFTHGTDVLEFYDMNDVKPASDLAVLAAYTAIFQIAFALVLQRYHTGKR